MKVEFELKNRKEIDLILKNIIKKSKDGRKYFASVGLYFYKKIQRVFRFEGAYQQSKWKAFSENTLRNPDGSWRVRRYTSNKRGIGQSGGVKYNSSSKLLQSTGQLRASFKVIELGKNFIRFGSKLLYAQKHNEGDGPLPARRMLWISKADIINIKRKWNFFTNTA